MISRYSCQHSHSWYLLQAWQLAFNNLQDVLLPFCCSSRSRRFGGQLEPRDIFGAFGLDQWAITLSSKDGCFQAHLLVVFAQKLPFPLSCLLETLAYDLGCFPLGFGPLHPKPVCKRLVRVFGVSLESVRLWATLSHGVLYPPYHSCSQLYYGEEGAKPPPLHTQFIWAENLFYAPPKWVSQKTSYLRVRLAFHP